MALRAAKMTTCSRISNVKVAKLMLGKMCGGLRTVGKNDIFASLLAAPLGRVTQPRFDITQPCPDNELYHSKLY